MSSLCLTPHLCSDCSRHTNESFHDHLCPRCLLGNLTQTWPFQSGATKTMIANKVVPKFEISNQADHLKLAAILAALISLVAILQIVQLAQNLHNDLQPELLALTEHNGTNKTESVLRNKLGPNTGHNQAPKSLLRPRRSLPFQEDEEIDAAGIGLDQLAAFEGLVIPETMGSYLSDDATGAESEHKPFHVNNLYPPTPEQQHHSPQPQDYLQPTYYSMSLGEPNEVYQQHHQPAMVNHLVNDKEPISMVPPATGIENSVDQSDVPRWRSNRRHLQETAVDMSNQVPESFDHLVKDIPVDMAAHDSYEPAEMMNSRPTAAQSSSNYLAPPKVAEFRLGHNHVVPIHSADLNAAAGHYYGKKKHHTYVKKKVYFAKKKKVIIVKKVKKKKKKKKHHHHHGGGHHDHGKYYMYAKVPKKKSWEFGYKRGNKKHWVARQEKGHKNKFKTQVKWYDAKSKGKGHHVWDYNHHDKKKKKHYG